MGIHPIARQRGKCDRTCAISRSGDLELRAGRLLPQVLLDWLRICKGEAIGQGGIYGARPERMTVIQWRPEGSCGTEVDESCPWIFWFGTKNSA